MEQRAHGGQPQSPGTRQSVREYRPPAWLTSGDYVILTDGGGLESYKEALKDIHQEEWIEAMQAEMRSLYENLTFDLVDLPKGR